MQSGKEERGYKLRYIRIIPVFFICAMLAACAVGSEGENESGTEPALDSVSEDNKEKDAEEINIGDTVSDDSYIRSVTEEPAWSSNTILSTGEEQVIIYRTEPDTVVKSAAGNEDVTYAVIYDKSIKESPCYRLIAIDKKSMGRKIYGTGLTLEEIFPVSEIDSFADTNYLSLELGYYNDTLYMLWIDYDAQEDKLNKTVYAYKSDDGGNMQRAEDETASLMTKLLEENYSFGRSFSDIMVCLNEYDRIVMWNYESLEVHIFDTEGNILKTCSVDSKVSLILETDGRYLIAESPSTYSIYDLDNDDNIPIMQSKKDISEDTGDTLVLLDVRDGCIYYCVEKWYSLLSRESSIFYKYDINLMKNTLLFETKSIPGQPDDVTNGISGFLVREDKCYFLNYDDGSLWWFMGDLSGGEYAESRLGLVDEYRGIFNVGEVGFDCNKFDCAGCGDNLFGYYVESIRLSENVIPHAEQINEVLKKITQTEVNLGEEEMRNSIERYQEDLESHGQDEMCKSSHFGSRYSLAFDYIGSTQYTFECADIDEETQYVFLEVDFSGDEYMGVPYKCISFFDLSDGSEINIGDICNVSEERFRTLAAEYTVEDYRENNSIYFVYDEKELYDEVYEYVNFDVLMHLSDAGVVIEYSPFHLGPFISGFIQVTIPYEELGIRLVDIYGVNAE